MLVSALQDSQYKAFRTYVNKVQWTTIGDAAILGETNNPTIACMHTITHCLTFPLDCTDDSSQLSVTPELDEPLRILQRNFEFLSKALSTASFRRVWHAALEKLQDLLWSGVLLKQSFTTLGAAQFAHDCGAIFALVERFIPGGSGALDSLREGLQLLNLPTGSATGNDPSADAAGGAADGAALAGLTLKVASDRAFTDNDEARRVLEELGFENLTAVNARYILQRRVENNENIGW